MPHLGDVLASNVRAQRARRRWRQSDLASRTGWSKDTISDIETGRRRVGVEDIPILCRALEVTLPKLLEGADSDDLVAIGLQDLVHD